MLLVHFTKYHRQLYPLGPKDIHQIGRHTTTSKQGVMESVPCKMRSFEDAPKVYQVLPEQIEVLGLKLRRYLDTAVWVLQDNVEGRAHSVLDLLALYYRCKVPMPFEDWVATLPTFNASHGRHAISIFESHEGDLYVFYTENRRLRFEKIEGSSFIRNGVITTMTYARERQLAEAQEAYDRAVANNKDLGDMDSYTFMPDLIEQSNILRYVKYHP